MKKKQPNTNKSKKSKKLLSSGQMNVISKELFVEIIEALKQQYQYDNAWSEKMSVLMHSFVEPYNNSKLTAILTKLLQYELEPNITKWSDIEYFMYELDFGAKYKSGTITDNGKIIDFSTSGKLYDYLAQHTKSVRYQEIKAIELKPLKNLQ